MEHQGPPYRDMVNWMVAATSNTLLLATIESAFVLVAFSGLGQVLRTVLGMAIGAGFTGLFRIGGLGIVQFRK